VRGILIGLLFAFALLFIPSVFADTIDGCAAINTSAFFSLTQNATSTGSCISINASNTELNCSGFTITYGTAGGNNASGINVSNFSNITIKNCIIIKGSASGNDSDGILFLNLLVGNISNNTIRANGTIRVTGINLSSAGNVTITGNIIAAHGRTKIHGISIFNSYDNNITFNNLFSNGSVTNGSTTIGSSGIWLRNSSNTRIISNNFSINETDGAIFFVNEVSFTNITSNLIHVNGSIEQISGIRGSDGTTTNRNDIISNTIHMFRGETETVGLQLSGLANASISMNTVSIHSTTAATGVSLTRLNFSVFEGNAIFVNDTGGGSFGLRVSTSLIFSNITSNIISLNGTSPVEVVEFAGVQNSTIFAFNNLSAFIGGAGGGTDGIESGSATGFLNITSNIIHVNSTEPLSGATVLARGIVGGTNNAIISSNTIRIVAIAVINGIRDGTDARIVNNTIVMNGTNGTGIVVDATRINMTGNTISGNFTGGGNRGIQITTINTSVKDNTIAIRGTTDIYGIEMLPGTVHNTTVFNTTITVNGSARVHGIITNNRVLNNTFDTVNITIQGNGSGIALIGSGALIPFGNLIKNITFRNLSAGGIAVLIRNGLNNTINETIAQGMTLENTSVGAINYTGTVNLTNTTNFEDVVRIRNNSVFVNSTRAGHLNLSAIVTLRFSTNIRIPVAPLVDFDDDGINETCGPSRCVSLFNNATLFIFNVTSFTTYSSSLGNPNVTLTKSDNPDPVNVSSELNYTIIINNTGTVNASNTTLTETYPNQTIFSTAQPTPLAGTNTTFIIGNLTAGSVFTINITVNVTSGIVNGTLINNTANISFMNATGAQINLSVTENTTILAPVPSPTPTPSGGGGGSGGSRWPQVKTKPVEQSAPVVEQPSLPPPATSFDQPRPKTEATADVIAVRTPETAREEQERVLAPDAAAQEQAVLAVSKHRDTLMFLSSLFYSLALIALVGLSVYWYALQRKK